MILKPLHQMKMKFISIKKFESIYNSSNTTFHKILLYVLKKLICPISCFSDSEILTSLNRLFRLGYTVFIKLFMPLSVTQVSSSAWMMKVSCVKFLEKSLSIFSYSLLVDLLFKIKVCQS